MINAPDVWKAWVKKYGHSSGFKAYMRKMKRRKSKTSNKTSKRRKRS